MLRGQYTALAPRSGRGGEGVRVEDGFNLLPGDSGPSGFLLHARLDETDSLNRSDGKPAGSSADERRRFDAPGAVASNEKRTFTRRTFYAERKALRIIYTLAKVRPLDDPVR